MRWISLVGAALVLAIYLTLMIQPATAALFDEINGSLASIIVWFALLAFVGFGMKYLNFSTPYLGYANEAVLPFYILHQTVLLSIGFFVVQWSIPAVLMWLIISVISFAIIMLLYEYLVRRHNALRYLFGMKELAKVSPAVATEAALVGGNTR
jgi:glucan biosynthesis protein C